MINVRFQIGYKVNNDNFDVGLKRYLVTRGLTMFGVLMITLLLTISLVGSNMDTILKQGVIYQVRAEITENTSIMQGFNDPDEFEKFVQQKIDERIKVLGLDTPWYSPQRLGYTMYKIIILDFGNATFLTSDSGSSNVGDIIFNFDLLSETYSYQKEATDTITSAKGFLRKYSDQTNFTVVNGYVKGSVQVLDGINFYDEVFGILDDLWTIQISFVYEEKECTNDFFISRHFSLNLNLHHHCIEFILKKHCKIQFVTVTCLAQKTMVSSYFRL